ncbi:P4 family phage/plasmid primase-like protein [Crossiella equi]|uniref:P4 family phage/plasmid primase-like protein n=1 Tax=Crossiella equi TaxID=130796 RepID=A0ABS5ANN8_9PSEU|nr:phage/plasmid primase, P4 family [Crossiella equi]MBP2478199.1 P4 family phage/plasmid primase-like protein [Crossiella equi]
MLAQALDQDKPLQAYPEDLAAYVHARFGVHELGGLHVGVTAIRHGGQVENRSVPADDIDAIIRAVAALDADETTAGVFLAQALADRPLTSGRYRAVDARALTHLWAEIDFGKLDAPPTAKDAMRVIDAIGLQPTLIKNTGHGLHVEFALAEPWRLDTDADRREAADLERDLVRTLALRAREAGLWEVDRVGDLARIMRVVGTTNRKDLASPKSVAILLHEPNRAYEPSEIRAALVDRSFLDAADQRGGVTDGQQRAMLARIDLRRAWSEAQRGGAQELLSLLEEADPSSRLLGLWREAAAPGVDDSREDLKLGNSAFALFRSAGEDEALHKAALVIMSNRIRTNRKTDKVDPARRVDYLARTLARIAKPRTGCAEPMPLVVLQAKAATLAEPPFAEDTGERESPALAAPETSEPIDFSRSERWDYSHEGNAARFVAVHGTGTVAWVPGLNVTRTWRGNVWATDTGTHLHALWSHVTKLMRVQADAELKAAQDAVAVDQDDQDAKAALKRAQKFDAWATKSRMGSDVKYTVTAVRALPGVEVPAGLWDSNPRLLNVGNGTLEIDYDGTPTLREHRAADRITQQSGTAYDPDATAPSWEKFLGEAIPDAGVRRVFQALAGLSLLGDNAEHVFGFLIGPTRSGKTVALETLGKILDSPEDPALGYSGAFELSVLRPKRESGGNPQLVRLLDRRMVWTAETADGLPLNADQLKRFSGGDRIAVRDNYARSGSVQDRAPKFVPWAAANKPPQIEGADAALAERIIAIPFPNTRPADRRETRLAERIAREESSGVLNWALAGLKDVIANPQILRSELPKPCRRARDEMLAEVDPVRRWLAEATEPCDCENGHCCVTNPAAWGAFRAAMDDQRERGITQNSFSRGLKDAGHPATVVKIDGRTVKVRRGLRLTDEYRAELARRTAEDERGAVRI